SSGGATGRCTPSRWSAGACCWKTSPWRKRCKGGRRMGAIKALRALLGVLLCALLALSLWLTAQRQVLGREEAQLFGYTLKAVETSAMEPALPQGGLAAVAASPSYELGDPVPCGDGTLTRLAGALDGHLIARGERH